MKRWIFTAALCASPSFAADDNVGEALSSAGQRYVFGQINGLRKDTFMLDTAKGRLWKAVCFRESEDIPAPADNCMLALEPVTYINGPGYEKSQPPAMPEK